MSTTDPRAMPAVALMRDLQQELVKLRDMPDVCDEASQEWLRNLLEDMDNLRAHLRGMF